MTNLFLLLDSGSWYIFESDFSQQPHIPKHLYLPQLLLKVLCVHIHKVLHLPILLNYHRTEPIELLHQPINNLKVGGISTLIGFLHELLGLFEVLGEFGPDMQHLALALTYQLIHLGVCSLLLLLNPIVVEGESTGDLLLQLGLHPAYRPIQTVGLLQDLFN